MIQRNLFRFKGKKMLDPPSITLSRPLPPKKESEVTAVCRPPHFLCSSKHCSELETSYSQGKQSIIF